MIGMDVAGSAAALTQFYKDWQQALQTVSAAQNDALLKEARFKGAAELVHGKDATFEYNEATGLTFVHPNRETRRALVKRRPPRNSRS